MCVCEREREREREKMEEEMERGKSVVVDEDKWVYDSSVDHKGRVPLRVSTGVWKASLFIIGKHKYVTNVRQNQ